MLRRRFIEFLTRKCFGTSFDHWPFFLFFLFGMNLRREFFLRLRYNVFRF